MATSNERVAKLEERVTNHIKFFWVAISVGFFWLGGISYQLYVMNGKVGIALLPQQLQKATANVSSPEVKKEVQQILSSAKKNGVLLPEGIVKDAGLKFIAETNSQPEAWPTVQQFLDYRSFLNANFIPSPDQLTPTPISGYQFEVHTRNRANIKADKVEAFRVYSAGGYTKPEGSARLESLNNPSQASSGVGLLVVDGGADIIVLDDENMKNVIIRNATVEYDGGPIKLDNVYFVNCHFNFKLTPKGKGLSNALLASGATSFDGTETTVGFLPSSTSDTPLLGSRACLGCLPTQDSLER